MSVPPQIPPKGAVAVVGVGTLIEVLPCVRDLKTETFTTPRNEANDLPVVSPNLRRILIVDDDFDEVEALSVALTPSYEVSVAYSGDDGLAQVSHMPPDLILLDVCLPGLNGFDVIDELANNPRTATVPILLLSGTHDLATQVRGRHPVCALDFLGKPYDLDELLSRIENCLWRSDLSARQRRTACVDELTGVGNMRLFNERLATEESRMERHLTPLCIVMADVDGLKGINDHHGHAVGSAVLNAIGGVLMKAVRDIDVAARYGGDEFVVMLPHTDLAAGEAFCQRLLDQIRQLRPHDLPISISIGVAATTPGSGEPVESLFERADAAAYRAKKSGGNLFCSSDSKTWVH